MNARERLIVALDVSDRTQALDLVRNLRGQVGMFKVGSQLFTAAGPELVREIVRLGEAVFLDLKFHDIPNTVVHGAREAARLGVRMLTVHASGGRHMLDSTVRSLSDEFGDRRPWVLAVTVLTSLDLAALREIGVTGEVGHHVLALAELAASSGVDGVVCSPLEIAMLRRALPPAMRIVTPGIRMPGGSLHDQERIATPREAIAAGADYLVIGRAVTEAADPRGALESIISSL